MMLASLNNKNANENANEKAARHYAGRLDLSLPFAFLDVLFGFNAGVLLLQFGIPSRAAYRLAYALIAKERRNTPTP